MGRALDMPIKSFQRPLLLLLAVTALSFAQEPVKTPANSRIMTATRQVSIFGPLEQKVLSAVQKKDKAALAAMLTDDFAVEVADSDRIDGEEWIESVMNKDFSLKSFAITQVSVNDLGDRAIVKFNRAQQATYKGKNESGDFFVVDVWSKIDDSWKLANRYVAKLRTLPATLRVSPKPTGKQ
jgi:ketosteroid isomerase-like protein